MRPKRRQSLLCSSCVLIRNETKTGTLQLKFSGFTIAPDWLKIGLCLREDGE
jgi:hypothetical protein